MRALCVAFALLGVAAGPAAAEPYPIAVLNALDKVTGRVTSLRAPVGRPVHFAHLTVTVHACDKPPPEDPPEAAAYLEIAETRADAAPERLFRGWMFASSPGLNALEHPVYDVWVKDCESTSSRAADKAGSPVPE